MGRVLVHLETGNFIRTNIGLFRAFSFACFGAQRILGAFLRDFNTWCTIYLTSDCCHPWAYSRFWTKRSFQLSVDSRGL